MKRAGGRPQARCDALSPVVWTAAVIYWRMGRLEQRSALPQAGQASAPEIDGGE
jgi:hypothetical protein